MSEFATEGAQHSNPAPASSAAATTTVGRHTQAATATARHANGGIAIAPDERDHSMPSLLGWAADVELRTLLAHLRENLAAYDRASTQPERDAALQAIDTRVQLAFDHIPAEQYEAFRHELGAALGVSGRHALATILSEPHAGRGTRARHYLGDGLATPAPSVEAAPEVEPTPPASGPEMPLAAKLLAMHSSMGEVRSRAMAGQLQIAMDRYGITHPAQQAMFIAQTMLETGGYATFREHRSDASATARYETTASTARRLGNTEVGDGARYLGRGALQITGREAYRRAGERVGRDLLAHPEQAEEPDVAFLVSAAYWANKRAASIDHFNTARRGHDWSWIPASVDNEHLQQIALLGTGAAYDYISLGINGGVPYENLPRRHEWFARAAPLWGLSDEGCAAAR